MGKCIVQCVFRSRTDRIEPESLLSAVPLPIKLTSSSDAPKEAEVSPLLLVQPTLYSAGDGGAPPPTSLTGHLARDPSAEQSATAQLTGHCPWESHLSSDFSHSHRETRPEEGSSGPRHKALSTTAPSVITMGQVK